MEGRYSLRDIRCSLLFVLVALHPVAAVPSSLTTSQCPNKPAGRLESEFLARCPVPGRIGILDGETNNAMSWSSPPKCITQTPRDSNIPRLDCLFASTEFRNGHGISMVTTTATASHLIGLQAFSDKPLPLASRRHGPQETAYEIVPVHGKGRGVVAIRRIRRGEILMVDVPALLVGISFLADTKPHHRRRLLKQALSQLPRETRGKVYGLHRSSSKYEVDAILGPNSNTVMVAGDEVHVGLFPEAAVCPSPHLAGTALTTLAEDQSFMPPKVRFILTLLRLDKCADNPSAYYRFSEDRLTMEVVAYRVIEKGEEVVMSCEFSPSFPGPEYADNPKISRSRPRQNHANST